MDVTNVGMIIFFIWYFHKNKLRSTSSPQSAHLKCLKTYYYPFILSVSKDYNEISKIKTLFILNHCHLQRVFFVFCSVVSLGA